MRYRSHASAPRVAFRDRSHCSFPQPAPGAGRTPRASRRRRRSTRAGLGLCLGIVTALAANGASAGDRDERLERCRYLHKRIAHFTRLRRAGGSAGQMERWRRQRQGYEVEYRERRCYRFGGRLTLNR